MRQGRPLDDDELAVIHHLTHVHRPAWTRKRIADALECARGTVSSLVNGEPERCAAAYAAVVNARRLDELLADLGLAERDELNLTPPRSIEDDDVFADALELIVDTGWPAQLAFVAVGVRGTEAAQWIKRAQGPSASAEDADLWNLLEQARARALLKLWQKMGAGKAGWQALRAQIQDLFGDAFDGDAGEVTRDPLAGVPPERLKAVVYGDDP